MSTFQEAQSLLQQYLTVLAARRNHTGVLYLLKAGGSSARFFSDMTWINLNIGAASASEHQQLRAFVEIVGQLSKSANFQWWEVYHSFWKEALMNPLACSLCSDSIVKNPDPIEYDNFEQLMGSDGPRFLLDFVETKEGRNQLELLRDFLLKGQERVLRKEHANLLSKLTARVGPEISAGEPNVPRIELGIALSSKNLATASNFRALAKLLDAIAEHGGRKCGGDVNAVRFEVTRLWLPVEKSLLPVEIDILADMVASETSTIQHLHFANALMMLSVDKRLQVFQHLLRTTVCSLEDSEPTLKTLHLQKVPLLVPPIASICSSLQGSNSLKELHLEWVIGGANAPAGGNTKLMWAWIAFGIFHPDSEAKLDRLNLTGLPLTYEDLTTFAFTIRTPHPGRQLWILERGDLPQGSGLEEIAFPADQRVFVQLKANTEMRVNPKNGAKALEPVALDSEEFEVAVDMTTWVCVVVPGCGLGWVPSASIVSRREMRSKCPAFENPSAVGIQSRYGIWPLAGANVKTFGRNKVRKPDEFDNIKRLLRMIGHCLEGFKYPSHEVAIQNSDLAEILYSCPNLTYLNLKGNSLVEIAALVDRYETQRCRIACLNVQSTWRHHKLLDQLAELLESPFSKPLRYVVVNGLVDSTDRWEKLERALKVNKSLELMVLNKPNGKHIPLLKQMRADMQSVVTGSRLPLSTKVAFLSVIKAHSTTSASSSIGVGSLGKLDSQIASQIFALAGSRIPRTLFW